ncbi:MAG TPA: EAL domain-containing protein [Terracidiphilus sp.]|nr:EAL domain-containing protein [Terracidiphilus sp.]
MQLGHNENECWRVRKHGGRYWASLAIDPIYDKGKLIGFAKAPNEILPQPEIDVDLAKANHHLETALAYISQGVMLYDSAGRLVFANPRLNEIFAVADGKLHSGFTITKAMEALGFSRTQARRIQRTVNSQQAADLAASSFETTRTGRIVSMAIRRLDDSSWIILFEDVTDSKKAELKAEYLATHDPLTGLANRTFFRTRLEEAVARMKRGIPFALLLLDVNDFSAINDEMGEPVGDALLKSIAQRVEDAVREIDTVARLDGDAFAIIQCDPGSPKEVEALASRLMERCGAPHEIGEHRIAAPVSLGVAMGTSDGSDTHELLKNAELALLHAKKSILPTYCFFNSETDSHLKARRALANELYEAAARGEFALHYQPVADARTGQFTGFEALLRWWRPAHGWVPPSEFVAIAEESGLIVSIGAWVLQTACAQAAAWPTDWHIAVNLSALQFQEDVLPKTIADALAQSGLDPRRLALEITESVLLKDNDANLAILTQLRAMGVQISLDDFGTGYSSLSYLRSFHFDKLKIDKSFVQDLPDSNSAKAIVRAVTELGKSFGISIVAEGVETEEQLEYLQQLGCDEVQGYLLGAPQPPEKLWDSEPSLAAAANSGA